MAGFNDMNGQLMVMAAHRYCLTRQTYIVSSCIEWLEENWDDFERTTQSTVVRDTVEELSCQTKIGRLGFDDYSWMKFARERWELLEQGQKDFVSGQVSWMGLDVEKLLNGEEGVKG